MVIQVKYVGEKWVVESAKTITIFKRKSDALLHAKALSVENARNVVVFNKNGKVLGKEPLIQTTNAYAKHPIVTGLSQHVIPYSNGWAVRSEAEIKPEEVFDNKYDAIKFGKQKARNYGSDLIIHYSDGTEQDRFNPMEGVFRPTLLYLGA